MGANEGCFVILTGIVGFRVTGDRVTLVCGAGWKVGMCEGGTLGASEGSVVGATVGCSVGVIVG